MIHSEYGRLDPPLVVQVATPRGHPLHHRFTWDNREAGHKWRLREAEEMIRSVEVTYKNDVTGEHGRVRAFHAVRQEGDERSSYEPVGKILDDPFLTKLVMRNMERDILILKARYERFEEFRGLIAKHLLEVA